MIQPACAICGKGPFQTLVGWLDHECIAVASAPALVKAKKYPKPAEKKLRSRKRKQAGYDSRAPEMCRNCKNYQPRIRIQGEHFPPTCTKHKFEVAEHATCDDWEDYHVKPMRPGE